MRRAALLAAALALVFPAVARAQGTPGGASAGGPKPEGGQNPRAENRSEEAPQVNPEQASYETGLLWRDWRKRLWQRGIDWHVSYTTETSSAVSGASGTRYTGQFEAGALFDLTKLGWIKGGKINVVFNNREGNELSKDKIHNLFNVQEVWGANQDARLVYLTYEQEFAGGHAAILAGRTNIGEDFAFSKLFCNFQQNGLCGRPRSLVDNGAFSNYPLSVWGGRLKVKPTSGASYIQTGAYEVNPNLATRDGFNWGIWHDTGVVIPVEAAYVTGSESRGTLGTYKIGGYLDTSRVNDLLFDANGRPYPLSGLKPRTHDGRWTGYVMVDQDVTRFGGDPKRPLTLLAGATVAQSDRSMYGDFWYAAAVMKGPFAARPKDVLGLLALEGYLPHDRVLEQELSGVEPQRHETVFEANYNFQVAPWLHIEPGAQEILDPGGLIHRESVTVLDLKTTLNF